ncbi:MAG: DUF4445 domain-containing protein [Clostridia bacterium]|nr:DUF4445 domain-containing protein [Clostridia bacterium]
MAVAVVGDRKLNMADGTRLYDALCNNGIFIDAPCGGTGKCGKCKVKAFGELSPLSDTELALLSDQEIKNNVRLSCECYVLGECQVDIMSNAQIHTHTDFSDMDLPLSDSQKTEGYGMAVDIGTTTVAAYFYDLKTARSVDIKSAMNAQREFGADVISRIARIDESGDNLDAMANSICNQINGFIDEVGVEVCCAVIGANTTMLHILARLNPSSIAKSPFTPQSLFGIEYRGDQLGLKVSGGVYLAPCISAYVGGDITAGMTACDMDKLTNTVKNIFYIDIGTNGEMALLSNGVIYCCSTAAGPAFEGASISCGTGSIPGAVNRVYIENGDIAYKTVGDKAPCGICGSGLIDAVACMLSLGVIDETGRLLDDDELPKNLQYRLNDEGFVIADNVVLTQKDIREVQLAKAAIAAGTDCLFNKAQINFADTDKAIVAGGFGASVNMENAAKIGLIPKQFCDCIEFIGNGSGLGASKALLSEQFKLRLDGISEKCSYMELSGDSYFSDRYIERMIFEELE